MPEKKWNNWIFQIPPLQYIQAISGGGRRAMSDSPLYNITCGESKELDRLLAPGYGAGTREKSRGDILIISPNTGKNYGWIPCTCISMNGRKGRQPTYDLSFSSSWHSDSRCCLYFVGPHTSRPIFAGKKLILYG